MKLRTLLAPGLLLLPALARAVQDPEPAKLGACVLQVGDLGEPTGVAFAPDGGLWVAESLAHRVSLLDAKGERVRALGEAVLVDPRDVAATADGGIVVSDAGLHALVVFDAQGKELRRIGRRGFQAGELDAPQGLDVRGDVVAVADARNDRVQLFALDGKALRTLGGPGSGDGRFDRPEDVAFAPDGGLYVADLFHQRVQRFSADGAFVRAFGSPGPNPGQFGGPTGVDCAGERVHVVDRDNSRVQIFGGGGELLGWYGIHALRPREGEGKLHYPLRLAVSEDGLRAAIAEPVENRIQVLGPVDPEVPELPPLPALPPSHYGGAIDADGPLIVLTEPSIPRVNLFQLVEGEPVEITNFGTYGTGSGQMLWPSDVALDLAARRIHVADTGSGRLLSFEFHFDPAQELRFDPERARFVEQLDLARVPWAGAVAVEPQGLWRDGEGGLCIADPRNRAVWRLPAGWTSATRTALPDSVLEVGDGCAGPPPPEGKPREQYVTDRLGGRVFELGSGKSLAEGLARPSAVLRASWGDVLVSEEGADALVRLGAERKALAKGPGLGPLELARPRGLAELPGGRIAVIDWANHRGRISGRDGKFLRAFGAQLFIRPTFASQAAKAPEPKLETPPPPAKPEVPALDGSRPWHGAHVSVSNGGAWLVFWRPTPDPIVERQTFALEAWVTPRAKPNELAAGVFLKLDAGMPEHGHGINVIPVTTRLEEGHFQVEGTRLHMPGRWEMYLDVEREGHTERAQVTMELD